MVAVQLVAMQPTARLEHDAPVAAARWIDRQVGEKP
jgi:hypothetical protein